MFSLVLPAFNEQKSLVNDDYLENLLNYLNKKYSEYEVIIVMMDRLTPQKNCY